MHPGGGGGQPLDSSEADNKSTRAMVFSTDLAIMFVDLYSQFPVRI